MTPKAVNTYIDYDELPPLRELGSNTCAILDDNFKTDTEFKNLLVIYRSVPLPFDNGFEFFDFTQHLLDDEYYKTDISEYTYSEKYISYERASKGPIAYLNFTFQVLPWMGYEEKHGLDSIQISLTKEEARKIAYNLLNVLNTTHFHNK